jgi:hypothetical protein
MLREPDPLVLELLHRNEAKLDERLDVVGERPALWRRGL